MARGRKIIVAGIVAACLAGVAMAAESTDDDFTKKEIKQCYKDNPGCTGECLADEVTGELVCTYPVDEDPLEYELCGGTKKNSNWQVWDSEDATAACTCADGYVTSSKVVDMWGDKDGYPKASKLCTIDCGDVDNVTCDDPDLEQFESGPLSCYCTDGTGDKYAEKEAKSEDLADLKDEYEGFKADLKDEYLTEKEALLTDLEDAKAEKNEIADGVKQDLSQAKADYKELDSELKELYEAAKEAIKNGDVSDDWPPIEGKLAAKLAAKAKPAAAKAKPAAPVAPAAKVAAAEAPAKKPVA